MTNSNPTSKVSQSSSAAPVQSDPPHDPTLPTHAEEKQFIEQGKQATEQMDPEANAIQTEFDSYANPPGTPKKSNSGNSVQSTLNLWTLVTPKDKMKQLRKVKAQERAKKQAQLSAQKTDKSTSTVAPTEAQAASNSKTVAEKTTYAEKALAASANVPTKVADDSVSSPSTSESPATVVTPTSKPKKQTQQVNITRPFSTYFTLKLKVQASKNSIKEMLGKATTFFSALKEVDGSTVIYGFNEEVPTKALLTSENIPSNINKFKEYFSGANPSPKDGHVWASIWLGHSEELDNLLANFKYWSMENDTFLYKKKLQEKRTVRDYFLLYSSEKIDTEVLHAEVCAEIKKVTNREFKFAFVWTVIKAKGIYTTSEKKDKKGSQYVKALHIEVPRQDKEPTNRMLNRFFGSTSQANILTRNLRMIPVLKSDTSTFQKAKISRLIAKQQRFINNLSTAITYDLTEIDHVCKATRMTMRQMIMSIETIADPTPLFLSIDYSSYASGYVLTFPTHLESEARDYIAQLPSFLHWLYGDPILELLTDFAVERAFSAPWDEVLMRAISQEDTALDALLCEANQVSWLRDDTEVIVEVPPAQAKASAFLFNRARDDDSISTFRTKKSRSDDTTAPVKKSKTENTKEVMDVDIPKLNTSAETKNIQQLDTPLLVTPSGSPKPSDGNNDVIMNNAMGQTSATTSPPTNSSTTHAPGVSQLGPTEKSIQKSDLNARSLQNRQVAGNEDDPSEHHESDSGVSL